MSDALKIFAAFHQRRNYIDQIEQFYFRRRKKMVLRNMSPECVTVTLISRRPVAVVHLQPAVPLFVPTCLTAREWVWFSRRPTTTTTNREIESQVSQVSKQGFVACATRNSLRVPATPWGAFSRRFEWGFEKNIRFDGCVTDVFAFFIVLLFVAVKLVHRLYFRFVSHNILD